MTIDEARTEKESVKPTNGSRAQAREDGPTPPARPRRALWIPLLAAALLGFAGGVGGYFAAERADEETSSSSTSQRAGDNSTPSNASKGTANTSGLLTPGEIYSKVSPAVVHVTATRRVADSSMFGFGQLREGEATGSGFVIDDDGHIVTNAHVIEGADKVSIGFTAETDVKAEVIGVDESSDIAVLKIDPDDIKGDLRVVPFGNSTRVQVGDPVVALGNPFSLDRTLTAGIVSALQRQIRATNSYTIEDVIQTDAPINPGNSGGPLLSMRGEVIGVNSQIQSESGGNVGIGFAVPSNTVKRVAEQLIKDGKVEHAFLGLTGTDINDQFDKLFKLPVEKGVLVNEVAKDSPADKAGLDGGSSEAVIDGETYRLGGDIIVSFDGEKVETMRELASLVSKKEPGDEVEIEFYDGDKKKTAKLELGTRPTQTSQDGQSR